MIPRLERQKKNNSFHIRGRLEEMPEKDFDYEGKVFASCRIITRFDRNQVKIPVIITGSLSEQFATKYDKWDEIEVEGMFVSIDDRLCLWVTNHRLVAKNPNPDNLEDKFKKVVALYSLDSIERRKQDEKEKENKKEI